MRDGVKELRRSYTKTQMKLHRRHYVFVCFFSAWQHSSNYSLPSLFLFLQTLTYYNLWVLYSTYMKKVDAIMITIFIDGNTGAEHKQLIKHTLCFSSLYR